MKNPFIKENNSGLLIAAAVTGLVTAGTLAWLYLKRKAVEPVADDHRMDYLKPKHPLHKKTTDLHHLHTIAAG